MRGSGILKAFGDFARNKKGNIAINLALALPVLLGALGAGLDVAAFTGKKTTLQASSDAAATAAAQQLAMAGASSSGAIAVAKAYLQNQLTGDEAGATVDVQVDPAAGTVTVKLTEAWTPVLAHYLNASITPIITTSVAQLQGETRLCVLTLNNHEDQSYRMMNTAAVQAPGCGIFSNSVSKESIFLGNSSSITASVICSSGGVKTVTKSQTSVPPQTDCPPYPDPLKAHAAPPVSNTCDHNNFSVSSGAPALTPGVYCNGLKITGTAQATFQPGTYVVSGGSFTVDSTASAIGTDVSFYLKGNDTTLQFTGNATIDLSGAETGVMAGLLFFGDRSEDDGTTHVIDATNARRLTGTIYLPAGDMRVQPSASVAANSAYTAIICNRIRILKDAKLVMNINYGATKVPVPAGVRNAASVVLVN